MKSRNFHIVPDLRLGGIFIYIKMLAMHSNPKTYNFIFKGQPNLEGLCYLGFKPFNFRNKYSPFIILDLILNTPQYVYSIFNSNKVFFHTPFLIFHHLLTLSLGKDSYLILHDYFIPYPLRIIFQILKPKNIFCASEVLIRKFRFLSDAKILIPYYSSKEISNLLENNAFEFKNKANIIFLGNINRVKQIGKFSILFNNYERNYKSSLNLSIYGEVVHKNIYYEISNLNSEIIKINKAIPHDQVNNILKKFKFIVIPSKSEVFPLVYFEALKANVIPLVNNIDFFNIVAGEYKNHIFDINEYKTFNKVFLWAKNLDNNAYKSYILSLKKEFVKYYKMHRKSLNTLS